MFLLEIFFKTICRFITSCCGDTNTLQHTKGAKPGAKDINYLFFFYLSCNLSCSCYDLLNYVRVLLKLCLSSNNFCYRSSRLNKIESKIEFLT